jgi:hypothetical protein
MTDRRLDFYIRELYEMLKLFSSDQFVELYNRTFAEERPISTKDLSIDLNEQETRTEFLNRISGCEKAELKRAYDLANHIRTRRK